MKIFKEIAFQLKRIADSLMMIELTMLKSNDLKYPDIQEYAEDYNRVSQDVSKTMDVKEDSKRVGD